jgi:hypothetical protein
LFTYAIGSQPVSAEHLQFMLGEHWFGSRTPPAQTGYFESRVTFSVFYPQCVRRSWEGNSLVSHGIILGLHTFVATLMPLSEDYNVHIIT